MTRKRRRTIDPDFDAHGVARVERGVVVCNCGATFTAPWIGNAWDAYYAHFAEMRSTLAS